MSDPTAKLIPIAIENYGALSVESIQFIKKLSIIAEDNKWGSWKDFDLHARMSLSVGVQCANADLLIRNSNAIKNSSIRSSQPSNSFLRSSAIKRTHFMMSPVGDGYGDVADADDDEDEDEPAHESDGEDVEIPSDSVHSNLSNQNYQNPNSDSSLNNNNQTVWDSIIQQRLEDERFQQSGYHNDIWVLNGLDSSDPMEVERINNSNLNQLSLSSKLNIDINDRSDATQPVLAQTVLHQVEQSDGVRLDPAPVMEGSLSSSGQADPNLQISSSNSPSPSSSPERRGRRNITLTNRIMESELDLPSFNKSNNKDSMQSNDSNTVSNKSLTFRIKIPLHLHSNNNSISRSDKTSVSDVSNIDTHGNGH
jgi:hypothetical protein